MIKNIAAAAFIATVSLSFAGVAQAEDIPATPMNHGPMVMTGMGPVGAVFNVGITPVNMIAQPISTIGTPVAEPMAPAPMMKKHHHRYKHMAK